MTTTNRLASGYQPNWDIDSAVGRQGELYVARIVDALRDGASIEIKTDEQAVRYRRVYLERSCLYGDGWRKTGLAETSAELWAHIVAGDVAVIAPTWRWRHAGRMAWRSKGLRRELTRGSHPTKGVVAPFEHLLGWLADAPPTADPAKPWEVET